MYRLGYWDSELVKKKKFNMALTSLYIIELILYFLSFVWKDGWIIFVFFLSDGAEAGYCSNDMKKHYVTVLKISVFYLIQLYLTV